MAMDTDRSEFAGRTILLTGGSAGIGLATARQIAEAGGRVFLLGRDPDRLRAAAQSLPGDGHRELAVDAADEEQVRALLKSWKTEGLKLDGAVFCAGSHAVRPARMARQSHYLELFSSNVLSVTNFVPGLTPLMSPGSAIVLVSSAAVMRGAAAVSAYVAAKSAVIGLGRSLAAELAPNVRVNTVVPGVVRTEMTDAFLGRLNSETVESMEHNHLLGFGQPEQVAEPICFLLSSRSSWMTGADIAVDGGLLVAS